MPILAAAGGRRRLIVHPEPPLKPNNGQSQGQQPDSGHLSPAESCGLAVCVVLWVVVLCYAFCKKDEEEEETTSSHDQRQLVVFVDREWPPSLEQQVAEAEPPPSPPLDCTWKDGTCSVCLGELAEDGEALKMLMPCKHYFHAACVDQWLRKRATCPICRAPTAKPKKNPVAS
ncbi:unnamed protein product [Urochloa humidicola]